MKKFTQKVFLILFALGLTFSLKAQTVGTNNQADVAPNLVPYTGNSTQALFDTQFNYDVTALTNGSVGCAGIVHLGTQFWVSKWQSDTIWKIDNAGTLISYFNISLGANGGIRALTTDGTIVYASQNGPEILKIDIATEAVIGTIAVPSLGFNVRSLTYDATANGGAGGFWVSNFTTAILQIDMLGNILNTIPAATHGLTGMYGSVIDNTTSATPKLWVFNQPGSVIYQIETATGLQTGISFDVNAIIGDTTAIAGGICIATGIFPQPSLVGIIQAVPNVMLGLELSDPLGLNEHDNSTTAGVFPVPASESINFVINDIKAKQFMINVFDINGKIVKSLMSSENKITISTKEFTSGVYTVKIQNGENTIVKKFMVN